MKALFAASTIVTVLCLSAFAHDHKHHDHYHGAPGPIAGAGLPILAAGYAAYWLIRRYRRKPSP